MATSLTAVFPQPEKGHIIIAAAAAAAAAVAFAAFALWPAFARLPDGTTAILATLVTLALLAWFGSQAETGGDMLGLSERVLAAFEALWPLVVITSLAPAALRAAAERGSAGALPSTRYHA